MKNGWSLSITETCGTDGCHDNATCSDGGTCECNDGYFGDGFTCHGRCFYISLKNLKMSLPVVILINISQCISSEETWISIAIFYVYLIESKTEGGSKSKGRIRPLS